MEHRNGPGAGRPEVSRRTLRLTIKSSDEGLELVSVERLQMITPPQPGGCPQAGKHGGHWCELRDGEDRVVAHRLIDSTMLNSVEVHSPDGTIKREFGKAKSGVVVVLLPDIAGAQEAVLVGEPLEHPRKAKRAEASREIARFALASAREGGK